ncbi:MAG: hypothetical protein AAFW60_09165 [Pseudomonadota bacterium]
MSGNSRNKKPANPWHASGDNNAAVKQERLYHERTARFTGLRVMIIPKLKRIKVSSEQELRNWLAKNSERKQEVMIVTCNAKSRDKHISSDKVRDTLGEVGWVAGRSYTLDGNLVGHVISNNQPGQAALGHPNPSTLQTLGNPAAPAKMGSNRSFAARQTDHS